MRSGPRAGLNQAIEGRFDLVLLDLMIPEMAGEEILSLLKPLTLKQRVVVVSGSDENEARARTRDLGAAGYIQKPVNTRQLTTLLADLLRDPLPETLVDEPKPERLLIDHLVAFIFGNAPPLSRCNGERS